MNFDKYKNKLKYPIKPIKICSCNKLFQEQDNFCKHCGKDVKKKREEDLKSYNYLLSLYRAEETRLFAMFKKDSLEGVGLTNHTKADKIFNFAWDKGHSLGYHEIYYLLEELNELFED